jgi:Xaa-Pro dipeptidase
MRGHPIARKDFRAARKPPGRGHRRSRIRGRRYRRGHPPSRSEAPMHRLPTVLLLVLLCACAGAEGSAPGPDGAVHHPDGSVTLFDGRVIPPMPRLLGLREQHSVRLAWLERRHELLLPMMRAHGIGMWIVVSEEFHDDPLIHHVAPPLRYTRRRDVKVFVDAGPEGLRRYSDYWRPTADYARFFEPLPSPRDERGIQETAAGLRAVFQRYDPQTVALNFGGQRGQDSGLTHDSFGFLREALGPGAEGRFVSAAALVEDYLDTRLPEEREHYAQLVLATDVLAQRALSNLVITPGVTRAVDVKWAFHQGFADLGVGATPWFETHVAVQRFDPEHGSMIPYVHPAPDDYVFQRGDIIHMDCGFDYMGLASDWQKVAYILREEETDVPAGLRQALRNANLVHEAFATAPRPGMTGWEATLAIAGELEGVDFLPSLYSHPIGNHGHALGASINARNMDLSRPPARDTRLRPGSYRSVEFSATTEIPEYGGGRVTIPMEDDAYLTDAGYRYFRPYQTGWYLIR